jgi:hypothetical protein
MNRLRRLKKDAKSATSKLAVYIDNAEIFNHGLLLDLTFPM